MSNYNELLAALPARDTEMMRLWIENYAFCEEKNKKDFAPISLLMQPWASAKSCPIYEDKSLWDLMGHQLILKREFEYTPDFKEYVKELNGELWYNEESPMHHFQILFRDQLFNKWCQNDKGDYLTFSCPSVADYYYIVDKLFQDFLVSNKILELPSYINEENGGSKLAPLKIKLGEKATRVIKKIVKAYTPDLMDLYDEFLVQYSQITQFNITVKGNLCLSIHPLDYMTMSDNKSDWSSCMSWMKKGSYRSGTIEMMNSPYVLEAYLESKHPMKKTTNNYDFEWNNKKWRCLYVFNKTALAEIREYPFQNNEISLTAFNWILELAEKNLGWTHLSMQAYDAEMGSPIWENHYLEYVTNQMYNDFRFADHKLCLHEPLKESISINYSGLMECMHCGKVWESEACNNEDPNNEIEFNLLECYDCLNTVICNCCGHAIPEYLGEYVDDELLCPSCANTFACYTSNDEERHLEKNCMRVCMTYNSSYILWGRQTIFYTELFKSESPDFYNRIIKYTEKYRCIYQKNRSNGYYFIDYESLSDEDLSQFINWYTGDIAVIREKIEAEAKSIMSR